MVRKELTKLTYRFTTLMNVLMVNNCSKHGVREIITVHDTNHQQGRRLLTNWLAMFYEKSQTSIFPGYLDA